MELTTSPKTRNQYLIFPRTIATKFIVSKKGRTDFSNLKLKLKFKNKIIDQFQTYSDFVKSLIYS